MENVFDTVVKSIMYAVVLIPSAIISVLYIKHLWENGDKKNGKYEN